MNIVCIVASLCVLSQYFRPRKLALLLQEEEELLLGAAVRLGYASTLPWRRAYTGLFQRAGQMGHQALYHSIYSRGCFRQRGRAALFTRQMG